MSRGIESKESSVGNPDTQRKAKAPQNFGHKARREKVVRSRVTGNNTDTRAAAASTLFFLLLSSSSFFPFFFVEDLMSKHEEQENSHTRALFRGSQRIFNWQSGTQRKAKAPQNFGHKGEARDSRPQQSAPE